MPLGKYKNFKACQKAVAKKGIKNTAAYCGAIEANIRGTRKTHMSPNFGGARQEAQNWVAGMGGAVLQPTGFYRYRDAQKYFTRVRTEGRTPSMYEVRTKKGITHKFYVRD